MSNFILFLIGVIVGMLLMLIVIIGLSRAESRDTYIPEGCTESMEGCCVTNTGVELCEGSAVIAKD